MSHCDFELHIAADPKLLCAVRDLVRTYVANLGYGEEQTNEVVLAVDEACANSIRHAYEGKTDESFRLLLDSSEDQLRVIVEDDGKPACAETVRQKADAPAPDRDTVSPGGLGIQLMHRVFDKVDFSPGRTRGNTVKLELRRPGANTPSEQGGSL